MEGRAATRAAKMLHKKWIHALTINLDRNFSSSLTSVKLGELFLELNSSEPYSSGNLRSFILPQRTC